MENYEDALWGFEKDLNQEIRNNRRQLVKEMQSIQQNHENSTVQEETDKSLHALNNDIMKRQHKVRILRTRIDEVERQNERIMRTDEHRKALVTAGSKLISFNMLTPDDIDAIQNCDYADDTDIQLVLQALVKIQQSLVSYSEQKKHKDDRKEPKFVLDSLLEIDYQSKDCYEKLIHSIQEEIKSYTKAISASSVEKAVNLLCTSKFKDYLQVRSQLLNKSLEIRLLKKKNMDAVHLMKRKFYE